MIASATVQFYDVVVFFHIFAVVLTFGPTYAYPVFLAVAEKEGGRGIPAVGRAIMAWDRIVITGGMVVILASGLYLTSDRWDFSDFFVSLGFLVILVLFGLAHGFFIPQTRKTIELAEREIAASGPGDVTFSAEFRAVSDRIATVGKLAGLIILLTVYFMSAKPFL